MAKRTKPLGFLEVLVRSTLVFVAFLGLITTPACTVALDFDDECAADGDCATLGAGLRCDEGFCVKKALIEPAPCATCEANSGCDRLYGEDPRLVPADSIVTLGTLLPRSGALGAFGEAMDNGVRLAVSEINQSGGVLGKKLAVISCDDGTDADQGERATRHLADVAGVKAIIGGGASGVTIEAFNRVAKAARILMMSPSATSPAITNLPDDGLLWRTAPSDAVQGRAIAEYLVRRNFKKVAIVNRNDAYGNGLSTAIQQQLCTAPTFACTVDTFMNRLYSDQVGALQTEDQAKALSEVIAFTPDAVILIAYVQDGVGFMNLASGKGLRFILTDGTRDVALLGRSENQPGVNDRAILCTLVGTNPASPSGELYNAFALKYDANFKAPPGTFAANSYDAAYLIALAYAAARGAGNLDPDGRALAEGLTRLSSGNRIEVGVQSFGTALTALSGAGDSTVNVVGVSGPLDFDSTTGEAPSGIEMWRFDNALNLITNLGVVYDGQTSYTFDAVLQDPPGGACGGGR